MARALITGIEGFTGRYLARELTNAGHDVFGITHTGGTSDERTVACDLGDVVQLQSAVERMRPALVVHLAAVSFVAHGDASEIYRTNVIGTRNLLVALAALSERPRAVLLASSANVYGNATSGVIDESVEPAPANDYAVSKLAMEYMAGLWATQLPLTIVRPFNYTGVGQSINFLLPKIVSHFRQRASVLELGNLDVTRDFSDVRDVVGCYRRLLDLQSDGRNPSRVLNVCSSRGYSLHEVLQMVGDLAGYMPEVRVKPALMRPNEVKKLVGSKHAIEQLIGPVSSMPLRDTLRWMLERSE